MTKEKPDLETIRERRVQDSGARRKARRRSQKEPGSVVPVGEYASARLFVTRESSEYDFELLAKMHEQTLVPHIDDESVREAAAIGVEPLRTTTEAEALRSRLRAREFFAKDSVKQRIGVAYAIGNDWFVLLLASAGKKTLTGDNDVTSILCALIEELRPRELVTGPISRIVRTTANAELLAESLRKYRTSVYSHATGASLDLTEPGGSAMWDMLARMAEAEYHATLLRLMTGVVMDLRAGGYPRSATQLPYGYRKRVVNGKATNHVEPDPDQAPIVESLIELGASDLPLAEVARQLVARHNLRSRAQRHTDGSAPLITDVNNPEALVRRLFDALPIYLTGIHRFRHEVTVPYLDDLFGFEVHRLSPDDNGYIVADLPFGLPDGGWHNSELIERAIQRRLTGERPTAPRDMNRVRPLAGFIGWFSDEHEYRLSTEDDRYCLRRRPVSDACDDIGRPRGFGSYDGELIGSFLDADLHRLVADAVESIADGVITDIPCPHSAESDEAEFAELTLRLEDATAAAGAARHEVTLAKDETAQAHYRQLAEEHQAAAAALAADLSQRRRSIDVANLRIDADRIAEVIVGIRNADPFGSRDLQQATRRLLRNVRIDARPVDPIATMSLEIEAVTNQGIVTLGPISFMLPNHALGTDPQTKRWKPAHRERREMLLRYVTLEEADAADRLALMASFPMKQRKWNEAAFKLLRGRLPTDAAISAILDCPILGVRRAVLGPVLGSNSPHGLDDEFAEEVRRIYLDPRFEWSNSWCPGGMDTRRQILHFIDRYDKGEGVPFETIRDHLGTNEPLAYALIGARVDATKYSVASVGTHALLDDVTGWYHNGRRARDVERPVRVRKCPHCGERKLLQPLKAPEVVGQVLCTHCHKDPISNLVYPDEYFLPWDGPQSAARRAGRSPLFNRYDGYFIDVEVRGTHPYETHVPSIHSPRRKRVGKL